jgi:hypothetical protein
MPVADALAIVKRETGGHFDPRCTEALFHLNLAEFIKIHLCEFLEKLEPADLVEMHGATLGTLWDICQKDEPDPNEMKLLRCFYRYYQGPVPKKFEGRVPPPPSF